MGVCRVRDVMKITIKPNTKKKKKINKVLNRRCDKLNMVFILRLDKPKVNVLPICIVTY